MKISVLCFDLSDNAAGRADLLARLLAPLGDVEVVGPRSGGNVWGPVAAGPVRYATTPERRMPAFIRTMREVSRIADGDLIYASKTRLGSAGIGYLKRLLGHRPMLLDIDDWEVGFYLRSGLLGTVGRALNLGNPKGLTWTWLTERLTGLTDGITVASRFLQRRFGGTLIPHVRDTEAWQPGSGSPGEARLGTDPDSVFGQDLLARFPGICLSPPVPYQDIPIFLSAADVVAVPQRNTPDTVGQVPAKLFDAMALGRPIVSTRVSMIPEILEGCGLVVPPGNVKALAAAIARLLDDRNEAALLGRAARERCVERYSFGAARRDLFPLVERALGRG